MPHATFDSLVGFVQAGNTFQELRNKLGTLQPELTEDVCKHALKVVKRGKLFHTWSGDVVDEFTGHAQAMRAALPRYYDSQVAIAMHDGGVDGVDAASVLVAVVGSIHAARDRLEVDDFPAQFFRSEEHKIMFEGE